MAAVLFVTLAAGAADRDETIPAVELDWDGYYRFLCRYFESANLDSWRDELIDLYGHRSIEGYQLKRLQDELQSALLDAENRPQSWRELVGWTSNERRPETEEWQTVERVRLLEKIRAIQRLVEVALSRGSALISRGD